MSSPKEVSGKLDGSGLKVALVTGRFNGFIVDSLVSGAVDALARSGAKKDDITVCQAPGAFEIPQVLNAVLAKGGVDAVVCLGAVIRGSTPHFDYVAGAVARGVERAAANTSIPVTFGVLTTDTIEQAIERAGTKAGNKGAEAALSAVEMVHVLRALGK